MNKTTIIFKLTDEEFKIVTLLKEATGIKTNAGLFRKALKALNILIKNGIKIK